MPSNIALAGTCALILYLLRIESTQSRHISKALWLPTIWFGICSSRAVGAWFTSSVSSDDGSIHDKVVMNVLILLGLFIIQRKGIQWGYIFKENCWLVVLLLYIFLSLFWSDFPMSTFKGWMKHFGLLVIALVLMCEKKPTAAFEAVLRRCAYILIPMSLCLIKWIPFYGVSYSYEGFRMPSGVTRHKNSLGLICALFSFTLIWSLVRKFKAGELKLKSPIFVADAFIILISIYLLFGGEGAYSATSIMVWILMLSLLIIFNINRKLSSNVAKKFKGLIITGVILFIVSISYVLPYVTSATGRSSNLSGRDKIWSAVLLEANLHPWFGTGYNAFWGLVEWRFNFNYIVHQAHNGYLDTLLILGRTGLFFLSAYLLMLARKAGDFYQEDMDWSILSMCFITGMLIYNYTEAAFLGMNSLWAFTVMLSIVLSAPNKSVQADISFQE